MKKKGGQPLARAEQAHHLDAQATNLDWGCHRISDMLLRGRRLVDLLGA
jgi:hypothetical protein